MLQDMFLVIANFVGVPLSRYFQPLRPLRTEAILQSIPKLSSFDVFCIGNGRRCMWLVWWKAFSLVYQEWFLESSSEGTNANPIDGRLLPICGATVYELIDKP